MKPRSLAFRLFASAVIWTLVVVPVAAILLISLYRQVLERDFDARLNAYLTNLVASSTASGAAVPETPASLGDPHFTIPLSGWYWEIKPLAANAAPLFASESLLDQAIPLPSSSGAPPDKNRSWHAELTGPEGHQIRVLEREIYPLGPGSSAYLYAVAGNAEAISSDLAHFTTMLIAALLVFALGFVAAILFQVRYGLLPLREMRRSLAAIRSGEVERLEGNFPDEIKPLQNELNALIESNRAVVSRARTHVGNLAHALKTPLSVIANEARGKRSPFARKVMEQAEIMRTQITHHLDRAQVAARSQGLGEVTDVEEALEALRRTLVRLYAERGLHLDVACDSGLKFRGERQDFEEMAGNLMDNACKWGKSRVVVRAEQRGPAFVLSVDDDGPGLDPAERARAVKRGQRLDESMPGSGLGLSIVADLAHLYHGKFALEPSSLGGLQARLTLPAA